MPEKSALEIYKGPHLKIRQTKEFSLFVIEWNHNEPVPIKEFQSELLAFLKLFDLHHPKNVLWLQEDFATQLSNEDQMWIETNINEYCMANGLEKCAFVMGKDVMAQMQVFNFFEETKSILLTKHFAYQEEAMSWFFENSIPNALDPNDFQIKFNGKTNEGKSLYSIETNSTNTESVLKSFNHIIKENAFLKANTNRFFSLTTREKEVFQLYANGLGVKKISEDLFISQLTVRTHWRNVKKKLEIKSHTDIADYKNSFFL